MPPEPPAFSLVRVDACTFEMGLSDAEAQLLRERGVWDDWFANEQPRHRVTLTRPFEIGRFEVTQEEWRRAMGSEPWAGQDHVLEDPACPAVGVSWLDCQAFLARLNEGAGVARYRLPTEAEWECASRAGVAGLWSFGDQVERLPEFAWYSVNAWSVGLAHAQPVGALRANAWGIHDMPGNVWEWCADAWGRPYGEDCVDPVSEVGEERVVRGGNFGSLARSTRCSRRGAYAADFRSPGVGFRVVRDVEGAAGTDVRPKSWGRVKGCGP